MVVKKSLDTANPSRPPLYVAPPLHAKDGKLKIQRVLVANRGEIACRVIRTCRTLGITSIAVYVDEDSLSQHIEEADEAINLGSLGQAETNQFLDIKLLVDVAVSAEADALHPGYGYLSENADFADAVRKAGIIFLGPSAQAMSTLGNKRQSKEYLRDNEPKVPLIPGFSGTSQNVEDLEAAAEKIGYPIMLKASAGGGGRGIRIVQEKSTLRTELERAQSEASRSFGSGDCILEKYIEAGKHVEVQIIGDSHGNVFSLWDRECSVQRRHQKLIEEAPSPWLTSRLRRNMADVAVRIGRLLGYESAGTVEFVVDAKTDKFYFLEVNARLQVEHPVTEEITGFDAVSLQIFVGAGGDLSTIPNLNNAPITGHAIECRLCAEDPKRDFFPEHGTIRLWQPTKIPEQERRNVRYETAVRNGSVISTYFDSMIAKIIVWAPDRTQALEKMSKILANTNPHFVDPAYTTSFIAQYKEELLQNPYVKTPTDLARKLSVIPSNFVRYINAYVEALPKQRPFQKVRRGFRNQTHDPAGIESNIIEIHDSSEDTSSLLCIHEKNGRVHAPQGVVKVASIPLPKTPTDEKASAALEVTSRYNAISNAIRKQSLDSVAYTVNVEHCKASIVQSIHPWIVATMDLTIDGSRIRAYLATEKVIDEQLVATQDGQGLRIFCHIPALGTWLDYRYYTILSYCESIREVAASASASPGSVLTAPMPCKVLKHLKNVGDEVKSGQTVMVIESMKMEMSITASVDGKYQTELKEGDAVNEGAVLCWIE